MLIWRGKEIVNISRAFLDTNGAHQETDVYCRDPVRRRQSFCQARRSSRCERKMAGNPERSELYALRRVWWRCSTVPSVQEVYLMPYGGKYQLTETQAMVAKLPVLKGKTDTVTMMSYGFDPYLSSWSPYHGAVYAVSGICSQDRGSRRRLQ